MSQLSQRLFFKQLQNLQYGRLDIQQDTQTWSFGQQHDTAPNTVTIRILNPDFYRGILVGGSLSAAEMFILGYWETDDLTMLLRLMLRNQVLMTHFERGMVKVIGLWRLMRHQFRRNHISGSRRNIAQHYDLSNEFFALFLDENMMYSSAIFPDETADLETAATHKLDVICQKLALKEGDSVMEIGSGWGGFALHAAKHYGCNIVTTTISKQQYDLAAQRIKAHQLGHKITLLQQDYRQLSGKYDKLVSIEMIEAVGHQYYQQFFKHCDRLLKPNGQMLIQAITIQDQAFHKAKKEVDFIKKYIFPGSCIPSVTALNNAMTRASQMKLFQLDDIGFDYAKTLKLWRERFHQQQAAITALGFDDRFIRMWHYYFSYCEAGFAEGYLSDVHLHCVKPGALMGHVTHA